MINTHGVTMQNGRWAGQLITRVPVSYLKWMVQCGHGQAELARAELTRRGTVTPSLEISGHAVDRASLRCRAIWHETARDQEEGLHAWLVRISTEALAQARPDHEGVVYYLGMKLVFEPGEWPVLKTIYPKGRT
jgi:hypothetical protein